MSVKKGFNEKFQSSTFGKAATSPRLLEGVSDTQRLPGALIVPVSSLIPNIFQVRQEFNQETLAELADDIKVRGILEPLVVRETEPGRYEIIAGERRYRAAQLAELTEVPVIVREMDDQEARFATLAENLQRQDLDPKDEQRYYVELMNTYNYSQADIAKLINKSRGYVQKRVEGSLQAFSGASSEKSNKLSSEMQKLQNSQSDVRVNRTKVIGYNPAVYKRVSQFFDNMLEAVKAQPDPATIQQIREDIADAERKLAELKKQLEETK